MHSSGFIQFLALSLVALVALVNASKKYHPLIYSGQDTKIEKYPFQAYLCFAELPMPKFSGTTRCTGYCGGVLINEKYVLTAAHCLTYPRVRVLLGSTDRRVKGSLFGHHKKPGIEIQDIPTTNLIKHKGYIGTKTKVANDIGLIKLTSPVKFSNTIKPAKLPQKSENFLGKNIIALGWGANGNEGYSPVHLQSTTGVVISEDECKQTFPFLSPGFICVKTKKNTGICKGDSGGPLALENTNKVIGVTSFMHSSGCENGLPFAYTNVAEYLDWIQKNSK